MLGWVINKLNKLDYYLTSKRYKKYCQKRTAKINRLFIDLWRESAVHKASVHDLHYVQKQLERENKEYVWIVEYHDKYIPHRR